MTEDNGTVNSDAIVDVLARMLCGDTPIDDSSKESVVQDIRKAKMARMCSSAEFLFTFGSMQPSRAYTFDATDDDRLYAFSSDLLADAPDNIIGDKAEILVMDGDVAKWCGLRRTNRLPRGLCTLTKCRALYEIHFRKLNGEGAGEYNRSMVGVTTQGKPTKVLIPKGSKPGNEELETLSLVASVIEDARRPQTMLAEFVDGASLVMPVHLDDYLELFSIRDAPLTPAGRRRALLHWVATHKRRKKTRTVKVAEHLRGVSEFTVDGLTVRLTPNAVR